MISYIDAPKKVGIRGKLAYIPENSDHVSVTADLGSGETFVGWINSASNGWVGNTYLEDLRYQTTNVWTNSTSSSRRGVNVFYMYQII